MKLFDKLWNVSNWIFYSSLVLLFIAGAYLGNKSSIRVDFTEGQRHTLAKESQGFLAEIEKPVTIRFYLNEKNNILPVALRNYADYVKAFLKNAERVNPEHIAVEYLDPEPDSEAEQSAIIDGIQGQSIGNGVQAYFGLSFSSSGNQSALPFLDPKRLSSLEYDVLSRVRAVAQTEKTKLGICTNIPIFGNERLPTWYFVEQLQEYYEIIKLSPKDAVEEELDAILIFHPDELSLSFERSLDKHLSRGGALIVLMDSGALSTKFLSGGMAGLNYQSKWSGLEKGTGLRFRGDQAVLDMLFKTETNRGQGLETLNFILTLNKEGFADSHMITEELSTISMPIVGHFDGVANKGLKTTLLLTSSEQSMTRESVKVFDSNPRTAAQFLRTFQSDEQRKPLSILLEGNPYSFVSGEALETEKEARILLIGDTDFLADPFAGQMADVQGRQIFTPTNNNIAFLFNAIDYLKNDTALSKARARTLKSRPLTRFQSLQHETEEKYQAKLASLEKKLTSLEDNQLSGGMNQRTAANGGVMSREIQRVFDAQQEELRNTQNELRILRRNLREEIAQIESRYKWINVAAIPTLLVVIGISWLSYRRRITAAR